MKIYLVHMEVSGSDELEVFYVGTDRADAQKVFEETTTGIILDDTKTIYLTEVIATREEFELLLDGVDKEDDLDLHQRVCAFIDSMFEDDIAKILDEYSL